MGSRNTKRWNRGGGGGDRPQEDYRNKRRRPWLCLERRRSEEKNIGAIKAKKSRCVGKKKSKRDVGEGGKKKEIPNGTIHREATCHAERRKTKDDRRKEEGQRVDFCAAQGQLWWLERTGCESSVHACNFRFPRWREF